MLFSCVSICPRSRGYGLILAFIALPLVAQTPVIPAGLVYQAAAANNIQYISPTAGQAIINQRATLNWRSILGSALADGSIGVLTGGLAGVIHMGLTAEVALAAGHAYYDRVGAPLLAAAAPNPNNIAPVLLITGTLAPSAGACVENSLFAVYAKNIKPFSVNVAGAVVSFTPQGVQVLRNISGQVIKSFQVIDVVACLPLVAEAPVQPLTVPQPTSFHPAIQARDGATFETTLPMASTSEPTAYALMWMRGN